MENINNIKGVIFDYGGTLDSRGVHWSEIIWQGYLKAEINIDKSVFREAYVYAERLLAKHPLILPEYNFLDLMMMKIKHELLYLKDNEIVHFNDIEVKQRTIAIYCYEYARECIEEIRPVLEAIKKRYPMVVVSNFYGNLTSVLKDFDLLKYFTDVIESAVVGVRKPNKEIFKLGVESLGMKAGDVLVVGDSYTKDIEPAMLLGCKTVWLKGIGWEKEEVNNNASLEVRELNEIAKAIL